MGGWERGRDDKGILDAIFRILSEKNTARSAADNEEEVLGVCRPERELRVDQSALGEREREDSLDL